MNWKIYLSGEIHTDWRQQIEDSCRASNLPATFSAPVTDHEASDEAGDVLGAEENRFWRDHKSAKVNTIRTKTLINSCDLAIVRFGDKYKQWNAAFDAGFFAALGKPYIRVDPYAAAAIVLETIHVNKVLRIHRRNEKQKTLSK